MAINFPSDRSELGFPFGPLQAGDTWINNKIEYMWVVAPNGVGAWSAKGVNINPLNYINKSEEFTGEVTGTFTGGLELNNAAFASQAGDANTANKVNNELTLNFTDALGTTTTVTYDGSSSQSITFADTDIAQQQVNVTAGYGVEIDSQNTISLADNIAIAGVSGNNSNNYALTYDKTTGQSGRLKSYLADNALNLGGLPASEYATKTDIRGFNSAANNGGGVNLSQVLTNQNGQPVVSNFADIFLADQNDLTQISVSTTGTTVTEDGQTDFIPSRFDIRQSRPDPNVPGGIVGSRSLMTSQGELFLTSQESPYIALRRKRNLSVDANGKALIGLDVVGGSFNDPKFSPNRDDPAFHIRGGSIQIQDFHNGRVRSWRLEPGGGGGGDLTNVLGSTRSIYELVTAANIADPDFDWSDAINQAGSIGGEWYFPPREKNPGDDDDAASYKCGSPILITQNGTKFIGSDAERAMITFRFTGFNRTHNGITSNHPHGMWCAGKTRLRNMAFQFGGSWVTSNRTAGSCLVLFQKTNSSGKNAIDDMDSSVDNCNFTNIRVDLSNLGSAAITYYGRNMRVTGTTFSSGEGSGDIRAIALSYAKNPDDPSGGQQWDTGGHRKNMVLNNTFHMTKDSVCVGVFRGTDVPDNVMCHGLLINGNMNDVGGSLLQVSDGAIVNAAAITGNSCIRGHTQPYIHVRDGGGMINSVISGNSFHSFRTDSGNHRAEGVKFDSGSSNSMISVTGNTFGAAPNNSASISLFSTDGITITGNTFNKEGNGQQTYAIQSDGGKGIITSNIYTNFNGSNFEDVPDDDWIVENNLKI